MKPLQKHLSYKGRYLHREARLDRQLLRYWAPPTVEQINKRLDNIRRWERRFRRLGYRHFRGLMNDRDTLCGRRAGKLRHTADIMRITCPSCRIKIERSSARYYPPMKTNKKPIAEGSSL